MRGLTITPKIIETVMARLAHGETHKSIARDLHTNEARLIRACRAAYPLEYHTIMRQHRHRAATQAYVTAKARGSHWGRPTRQRIPTTGAPPLPPNTLSGRQEPQLGTSEVVAEVVSVVEPVRSKASFSAEELSALQTKLIAYHQRGNECSLSPFYRHPRKKTLTGSALT